MTDATTVPLSIALLTTAASGVIGVIVAEIFAYLRESRRVKAEETEAVASRIHELRRDVYLTAASATVRMMADAP